MKNLPRARVVVLTCVAAFFAGSDPAAQDTQYVFDFVDIPDSSTEAAALGLDIDGDLIADNALGQVLATLSSAGALDPEQVMDEEIRRGAIILLANLRATNLVSATGARLGIFLGENPSTARAIS